MKRSRLLTLGLLPGLLLMLGAPFVGTAAATHVGCGATVTTSITLDSDVGPCASNGLLVGADNITIDLNGHRIFGTDGPLDEGVGVIIDRHSGVTVRNGTIERFDAAVAIDGVFGPASGNTVTGITAQDNFPTTLTGGDFGDGITIFGPGADNNTVSNSTVRNNGPFSGISVFGGSSADKVTGTVISANTVADNNSESSQTGGIRLENWTWDSTVSNNTVTGNALEGIALFADTQNNDVLGNTISGNGFTSPTATHRRGDGIRAFARTKFHLIQANTVTGNAGNGIRLDGPAGTSAGANDHQVLGNTATGNNLADDPPSVPPRPTPHHHDLSDGNTTPPCDNNAWRGNTHGTANQSCTTGGFQSDLSLTKADTPDPVAIGENVTYTMTVTNTGPDSAGGVELSDTLPAGATYRSASATQGTCANTAGTVSCQLGSIASGAAVTVTIVAEADALGTMTNTATVTSSTPDPAAANNSASATTTVNNPRGCTVIGTGGDDVLTGTANADVICGLGGNDTITGADGNDTIWGGYGNDTLSGGNQDDAVHGEDGDDSLHGNNGADSLTGGAGADSLSGDNGADTLNSVDGVMANDANDGGAGADSCSADVGDAVVSCP